IMLSAMYCNNLTGSATGAAEAGAAMIMKPSIIVMNNKINLFFSILFISIITIVFKTINELTNQLFQYHGRIGVFNLASISKKTCIVHGGNCNVIITQQTGGKYSSG